MTSHLQVSMLEKQFGFSSAETGVLMGCNDIGFLSFILFAGYMARKVNRPLSMNIVVNFINTTISMFRMKQAYCFIM